LDFSRATKEKNKALIEEALRYDSCEALREALRERDEAELHHKEVCVVYRAANKVFREEEERAVKGGYIDTFEWPASFIKASDDKDASVKALLAAREKAVECARIILLKNKAAGEGECEAEWAVPGYNKSVFSGAFDSPQFSGAFDSPQEWDDFKVWLRSFECESPRS
jgi:hypothetical protein